VDLALLEQYHAVRPVLYRHRDRLGLVRRDVRDRGAAGSRAHLLPGHVVHALVRRRLGQQQPLPGLVVHAGEADLLQRVAGDRHGARADVYLLLLDVWDALRRGDRDELHLVRVAEDRPGDLPGHVDVEALDLPGGRVAVPEQERVLVDAHAQQTT